MKQQLTESELRSAVYERVKRALSEAFGNEGDNSASAFILQPQYTNFIKTACHIIAWKGIDFDLNIRGNEYRIAKQMIDSYISEKQEAMKSSNPKEGVAMVKETWRNKRGCEGLVDSEKEAFEMFTQFKNEGYEFISRYLGKKNNSSKQMEKSAGLALFGKESDLSEFHIMHGAVFCVRDFFRWVKAGKPDFERTQAGKLKKGDAPLRQAGITGKMVNKDELGSEAENNREGSELWRDVKALLDERSIDSVGMAKALVGGSIRENQDAFQEIMLCISEYRTLIKGSKQNSDAFRTSAYDVLDKLVSKIEELHTESVVGQLLSGSSQAVNGNNAGGMNEGRLSDDSALQNEEKAKLAENSRNIKQLLAEGYELAEKIGDVKYKTLYGKMLEAMLKIERKPGIGDM